MKIVRIKKHLIIGIAILSMLTQSCMVYRQTPVSYSAAMKSETMQLKKIKTHNGKSHVYRQLDKKDGKLYGSYTAAGELKLLPFAEKDIDKILLLNKNGTIVLNTVVIGGGILIFTIIHTLNHMFDNLDLSM